jgi:hypothetical protein
VRRDEGPADEQPGDDERRDGGEEKQDEGRADEPQQRLAVGEGSAEEDDRLVGGAEEVEEAPGGEEAQEDEEREGVRQERGPQREGDHGGVVDAEVSEVATQAGGGVGERVWLRERRTVEELSPRPAIRQRAPRRVGDPAQEEPESRRSDRRIGASGGGRGRSGRRVGHREEGRRRRCGGHGVGDSEIRRERVCRATGNGELGHWGKPRCWCWRCVVLPSREHVASPDCFEKIGILIIKLRIRSNAIARTRFVIKPFSNTDLQIKCYLGSYLTKYQLIGLFYL